MPVPSIRSSRPSAPRGAPSAELLKGSRGPAVLQLQQGLLKLGLLSKKDYDTGPGLFGPRTQAALKAFQARQGLAADGIYGPNTRAALGHALATGSLDVFEPKPESPKTPPASTTTPASTSGQFPQVPHGRAGIERVFGKPGQHLVTAQLPMGPGGKVINVRLHEKLVPVMTAMLAEAQQKGLLKDIHSWDGMYNYRTKRGVAGSNLSTHSWGIAFDINASEGRRGKVSPELAAVFQKYGFTWGKSFNDEMHFQYATGY